MDKNKSGIGLNALPEAFFRSGIITGGQLELLASVSEIPAVDPAFYDDRLKNIIQYYSLNPLEMETELHLYASQLLQLGKVGEAWQVLLSDCVL